MHIPSDLKQVLEDAVKADMNNDINVALKLYLEGSERLMTYLKQINNDFNLHERCAALRTKLKTYIKRAEELKELLPREVKRVHLEELRIAEDDMGFDFVRIFGKCLRKETIEIIVTDPYIRSLHQIHNFVHFCEFVVSAESSVSKIELHTSSGDNSNQQQCQLSRIKCDLMSRFKYKSLKRIEKHLRVHDREIEFKPGGLVKMGRGLDMFKSNIGPLGSFDLRLRRCKSTTIDIFVDG